MIVSTEADVDATPEQLWTVLATPRDWPGWTESIDLVEMLDGDLSLGARVRITQPAMRPLVWTVSEFEPGRSFTWRSSVPGVTTVASHTLGALDNGRRCHLRLGLQQTGLLAPVLELLLGRRTRQYVELETVGLKAAAEHRASRASDASTS